MTSAESALAGFPSLPDHWSTCLALAFAELESACQALSPSWSGNAAVLEWEPFTRGTIRLLQEDGMPGPVVEVGEAWLEAMLVTPETVATIRQFLPKFEAMRSRYSALSQSVTDWKWKGQQNTLLLTDSQGESAPLG